MYLAKILSQFSSNLVCKVVYMEGIKYVNLIEISLAAIEIQGGWKRWLSGSSK